MNILTKISSPDRIVISLIPERWKAFYLVIMCEIAEGPATLNAAIFAEIAMKFQRKSFAWKNLNTNKKKKISFSRVQFLIIHEMKIDSFMLYEREVFREIQQHILKQL